MNATAADVRRALLIEAWRRRAVELERYARLRRHDGDILEAQDAEQAALEYRADADLLELGLPIAQVARP